MNKLLFLFLMFMTMTTVHGLAQSGEKKQLLVFGNLEINASNVASMMDVVKQQGEVESKHLTIICLGGFTDRSGRLDEQSLKLLKSQVKDVYLVPGSQEWSILGSDGMREFEDEIEHNGHEFVIPDNGCGEVEEKSIGEDAKILAIDSEWLLKDWDLATDLNKGCRIKNRDAFFFQLNDEVQSAKEKIIVLLSYHPPFRFDKKGGHQTLKEHIFPLTPYNKNLLFPLPYVGSLFLQSKSYLHDSDFATHPLYREFTKEVRRNSKDQKKMIILSADADHTAVTHYRGCDYFNINSGSDQKKPVVKFDGKSSTEPAAMSIILEGNSYRYQVINLQSRSTDILFDGRRDFPEYILDKMKPDSFALDDYKKVTLEPIFQPEDLTELDLDVLTGRLNTGLYTLPVRAEVLDFRSEGLKPLKIGGGQQTTSLRLVNRDNKEYVIRSLRKNPEKILPRYLRFSIAKDLLQYYFTSANPFSFLPVSALEESVGLFHTQPRLMFVPFQYQLSPYNDEIGDQLVLFSDRLDGDRSESASLYHSPRVISTDKMLEELDENKLIVSETFYLKNRLLDLVIGDWDRHEDQWRWAKTAEDTASLPTYYPVARDRDQALSNFDGLLLGMNRIYSPSVKPMRPFDDKVSKGDVKWQSTSGHKLDQHILTKIDLDVWNAVTKEFQQSISTEDINRAISALPELCPEDGKELLRQNLIHRMGDIAFISNRFYKEINDNMFIVASSLRDSVLVQTVEENKTQVKIYSQDENKNWFIRFDRMVDPRLTQTIHLYGQEGDDVFIVHRTGNRPRLNIIGGYGDDRYINMGPRSGQARVLKLSHRDRDSIDRGFKVIQTKNKNLESFTRHDLLPSYVTFAPVIRADRDDKFFFGLTSHLFVTKFKKQIHHYLGGRFSVRRASTQLNYGFEITNELKKARTYFLAVLDGPRYNFNFYGLGNATSINLDFDRSFYFVRRRKLSAELGRGWNIGRLGTLYTGANIQRIKLDTTVANRFINDYVDDMQLVDPQTFAGVHLKMEFENINKSWRPTDGVRLLTEIRLNSGLDNDRHHADINLLMEMYKSLDYKKRYIYSTRLQYQTVVGSFYFYQAPAIGGTESLRGWRADRFRGRSAFSHNHNLHVKVVNQLGKNFIPASMGVTVSFDYGRVWAENERSATWHTSWGAGLWISPLNSVVISASLHQGGETSELRATLGWQM